MATLIGDVFPNSSRCHTILGATVLQTQHTHNSITRYQVRRSSSRNRDRDTSSASQPGLKSSCTAESSEPRTESNAETGAVPQAILLEPMNGNSGSTNAFAAQSTTNNSSTRFPSPPYSGTPSQASSTRAEAQYETSGCMARQPESGLIQSSVAAPAASSFSTADTIILHPSRTMPSPDSDAGPNRSTAALDFTVSQLSSEHSGDPPESPTQHQITIRVRDLAHIHSLASADMLGGNGRDVLDDPPTQQMKYEIGEMPIYDIIEMVAALLTKITTANDLQHDALNRNAVHVKQAQAQAKIEAGKSSGNPLSSSVLAFHGKNVPAITILSYLTRIHKYCPTTYEVFLSLLVYIDRMTERVNDSAVKSERNCRSQAAAAQESANPRSFTQDGDFVLRDSEGVDVADSDLVDNGDEGIQRSQRAAETGRPKESSGDVAYTAPTPVTNQATYFVVDSFNIHRLIIAGVTCSSKFFSDVFYTNSRYAKVGGLPLPELNHLELQFLLLNDFRLSVPVEDLEAYATMLVEFYAREVAMQRSRPAMAMD